MKNVLRMSDEDVERIGSELENEVLPQQNNTVPQQQEKIMEKFEVLKHMVNDILSNKSSDALEKFNSLMAVKVSDSLDDKRQDIASTLYTRKEEQIWQLKPYLKKLDNKQQ